MPDHPAPRHPPIYYTVDPKTGKPVPTEESWIRGDYVYNIRFGSRFTHSEYIYPWRDPDNQPSVDDLTSRGWIACYTFTTTRTGSWDKPWNFSTDRMQITYFRIRYTRGDEPDISDVSDRGPYHFGLNSVGKGGVYFSPRAPTGEDLRRRVMFMPIVSRDEFLMENLNTIFS